MKLIIILFLLFFGQCAIAQKTDTVFSSNPDLVGFNKVKSIRYTTGDVVRTVNYLKGDILSIKHHASIKGCVVPIFTDSIFSEINKSAFTTNQHQIIYLNKSQSCDSLLRIETSKAYLNGELRKSRQYKYIGEYAKCPCGDWKVYLKDTVITKKFISCESKEINNLFLTKTFWSPDSNYYINVYKEKLLYALPGQGGDHMATIVLKEKSGKTIKVISSKSSQSVMHRGLYGINWELYKNTLWYAKAKNIEWVNESNIDLDKTRIKINRLLGTEHWDYFTTTEAYKSKCYAIGEFYGEPDTDRTLDMAILIKDSIGTVKLMVIDNYNYENSETFEFIELRNIDDFNWVGHFNAVRKTEPLWSNWVKGKGDGSRRELNEVPDKEITYLPYDAMFVHAGESCGGGFIFWKDNQWNWLQQE